MRTKIYQINSKRDGNRVKFEGLELLERYQGLKFHLYGTSYSGIPVDEYAVTDASGIATFSSILIGTGYTLEEVDTPIRYVVPDDQTAAIEWNKVTNKSFDNVLKKWNLTVTKQDVETGSAQGDASLAGAKYGIYNGDELIDTYGSIAQSESENISANVRWGKSQSAKEGNVPFHYKRFLGYRRGSDGKPEIDPEQAAVVKRIYERFLAGDSLATIANDLNADGIPTPSGIGQWQRGTIESILTNEKYKGDAILNKTYIRDCLSKKVMINNGERPKYYVENNHPAIIDSCTFGRVQEEMARRSGKRKVKQVGTKTEQGRYSSKYALTELLICGECGTPYRRCTWAANGKKKVVWRCINRLDYGKKYCHDSPSIEESVLQEAIMKAVLQTAKQNADVLKTLKLHIGMGLSAETTEDNSLDLQIRIAEVEAEFQKMLKAIAADNVEAFDEEKAKALMDEKAKLQIQLGRIADTKQKRENAKSRLDEIFTIIEALANHPISYDDQIVRQVLESVIVESKEKIKVVFVGGLEVTQLM